MEFFSTLQKILRMANPYEKIAQFQRFYEAFLDGGVDFDHGWAVSSFDRPSFASWCKVVDPARVPRRGRLGTPKGRAVLLHAIAHIEYSAIDLALDGAYRFRHMPMEFYRDWLEVAHDECRHFLMIDELLQELGYRYGDFEVHQGLFEAGRATTTLLERMAVVPRYLEANGLDANPKIIAKLRRFKDPFAQKALQALQTILREEIVHVRKGDRWFRWACEQEGIEDPFAAYFEIVERIYPGVRGSRKDLNVQARKAAGFACEELKLLAKGEIGC